ARALAPHNALAGGPRSAGAGQCREVASNSDHACSSHSWFSSFSLIPDRRRCTRRQRARVDLDHAMRNAHAVGNELLGERRRRAAVLQPVLVAVPGTGHAAVDDAPFADRPILVGAKIRKRPDLRSVAEHGDAFAIRGRDDAGALVRNRERRSDREPALAAPSAGAVTRPLAPT